MGSVVSVIDGGFTGFSDSDDDDKNEKGKAVPQTPERSYTPKPVIVRSEEVFDYYPPAKEAQAVIKKEIV